MMKPKDELCSIFWIVLVDLTGKFGHPSGNDQHVVDHIWNDDGQKCVDVGDVVGDVDHHNHGGFGEIVMTATSIADTTNFWTKSISITIKVMPHNMISTVTQLTWQKKFYRIYSAARVLYCQKFLLLCSLSGPLNHHIMIYISKMMALTFCVELLGRKIIIFQEQNHNQIGEICWRRWSWRLWWGGGG